jgi:hypothetical protein
VYGVHHRCIGCGAPNTINIEAGCTTPGTAADICANLTLGGYSDWFLPSMHELQEMYVNLHQQGLGGFTSYYYWTSTESNYRIAYTVSFVNGYEYNPYKNQNYRVRAVRAF